MKKIFVYLLSLIIVFTFGCTKKDEVPEGKTLITVWAHQGRESEVKAIKQIIDSFNKANPDIHARLTVIPSGFKHSYETKITAAKLSDKLPDVLDVDGPFVAQYAWSGILGPIDDLLTKQMRQDFLPSIIEQGTYRDKLYALGAFESGLALYYNKKILRDVGVVPPTSIEEAWSWDEFIEILKRIKDKGFIPLSLSMEWGPGEWYTYAFTPLIWSSRQNAIISPDGTKTEGYLDSSRSAEAMKKFQSLFSQGLSSATPPPDLFEQGKAAFSWNGHWMMSKLESVKGLEWGMAPLPYIKERIVPSGSWCWGITTQAKDKRAAFEVLSWIVGSETGVVPMVRANDAPPARLSALKLLPEYQQYPRKLFIEQLKRYAHPRPVTPSYGVLSEKFSDAVHNISLGRSVDEQLKKATEAIDIVLAKQTRMNK